MYPEDYCCHECKSLLGLTEANITDAECGDLVEIECPSCGAAYQVVFDSDENEVIVKLLYC